MIGSMETKDIPTDPAERRAWIKYQLDLRGTNMAQVGQECGLSRQAVYRVFSINYPKMQKIIADALDLEPQQLWPERYERDGAPKRGDKRGRKPSVVTGKSIQGGAKSNGKTRRAA